MHPAHNGRRKTMWVQFLPVAPFFLWSYILKDLEQFLKDNPDLRDAIKSLRKEKKNPTNTAKIIENFNIVVAQYQNKFLKNTVVNEELERTKAMSKMVDFLYSGGKLN